MSVIKETGAVRIDLLGGTLDLEPINLILPSAITLNAATSLQAQVTIEATESEWVEIHSIDYDSTVCYKPSDFCENNFKSDFFGPLRFIAQILNFFDVTSAHKITLSSGSPAGAGLGGSSAMGVTLFKACMKLKKRHYDDDELISIVKKIEAEELKCGPTGYQDYYPALHGGILALEPTFNGTKVHQLYSDEFAEVMRQRLTLVFSGQTRLSGINNWEVYKAFFDDGGQTKKGLGLISDLSLEAYESIKDKNYDQFFELIKEEGQARASLFPGIMTKEIEAVLADVQKMDKSAGVKMCGAGGGGCFLIIHDQSAQSQVLSIVKNHKMKRLDLDIAKPRA